jgi:hypothetical protein
MPANAIAPILFAAALSISFPATANECAPEVLAGLKQLNAKALVDAEYKTWNDRLCVTGAGCFGYSPNDKPDCEDETQFRFTNGRLVNVYFGSFREQDVGGRVRRQLFIGHNGEASIFKDVGGLFDAAQDELNRKLGPVLTEEDMRIQFQNMVASRDGKQCIISAPPADHPLFEGELEICDASERATSWSKPFQRNEAFLNWRGALARLAFYVKQQNPDWIPLSIDRPWWNTGTRTLNTPLAFFYRSIDEKVAFYAFLVRLYYNGHGKEWNVAFKVDTRTGDVVSTDANSITSRDQILDILKAL